MEEDTIISFTDFKNSMQKNFLEIYAQQSKEKDFKKYFVDLTTNFSKVYVLERPEIINLIDLFVNFSKNKKEIKNIYKINGAFLEIKEEGHDTSSYEVYDISIKLDFLELLMIDDTLCSKDYDDVINIINKNELKFNRINGIFFELNDKYIRSKTGERYYVYLLTGKHIYLYERIIKETDYFKNEKILTNKSPYVINTFFSLGYIPGNDYYSEIAVNLQLEDYYVIYKNNKESYDENLKLLSK